MKRGRMRIQEECMPGVSASDPYNTLLREVERGACPPRQTRPAFLAPGARHAARGVFLRSGDWAQVAPSQHLGEQPDKLIMNQAVRGQHFPAVQPKRATR